MTQQPISQSSMPQPNRHFTAIVNLFINRDGGIGQDYLEAFVSLVKAASAAKYSIVTVAVACETKDIDALKQIVSNHGDLQGLTNHIQFGTLQHPQRLPKLADILGTALTGKAWQPHEYAVFLNADINVPYYFFDHINANLNIQPAGSGLIINRKDMLGQDCLVAEGNKVLASKTHCGFDCHVFPAGVFARFHLGDCTVGLRPVGALLAFNMLQLLPHVGLLDDSLVTWHMGDGELSAWQEEQKKAENMANVVASFKAMERFVEAEKVDAENVKHLTHSEQLWEYFLKWKAGTLAL